MYIIKGFPLHFPCLIDDYLTAYTHIWGTNNKTSHLILSMDTYLIMLKEELFSKDTEEYARQEVITAFMECCEHNQKISSNDAEHLTLGLVLEQKKRTCFKCDVLKEGRCNDCIARKIWRNFSSKRVIRLELSW